MLNKINLLYLHLLKRNLNFYETQYFKRLILNKQFNLLKIKNIIINTKEYLLLSLQKIKSIYRENNIDVKNINEKIIINYLNMLKNGISFIKIKNIIIENINQKKLDKKNNSYNLQKLDNISLTYLKILNRYPTKNEITKFNNCENNYIIDNLIHSKEYQDLLDLKIKNMLKK